MKLYIILLLFTVASGLAQGQQTTESDAKPVDNYTVQYLIIHNAKGEILLQKNEAGWHTLAIRSNNSQSVKEAMDGLALSVGLKIQSLKLAGLYVYKFQGLPDHKEASFRMHFTAQLEGGNLIQPVDPAREYRWVPVQEALKKITFDSLKLETAQILKEPGKVWGGTFLIMWEGDKFLGSKIIEPPYPLTH